MRLDEVLEVLQRIDRRYALREEEEADLHAVIAYLRGLRRLEEWPGQAEEAKRGSD